MLKHDPTLALLWYLTADPNLHRLIDWIAQSPRIENFVGRVYRITADQGHTGDFHDDLIHSRVAAFSLSLSEEPLEGGTTTVRDAVSGEIKAVVGGPDLGPGDAVILRLRQGVEHRVEEVCGAAPKTSFVGFFMTESSSPLITPRGLDVAAR